MAKRVLSADELKAVRETFSYSGTDYQDTIRNFDNYSGTDLMHDQVDLTGLFDNLGGKYGDGSNDVQDRINAITLSYGDYDGDGKADDARLTINGVSDFALTFIEPAYAGERGFDLGAGTGVYDDIAVMTRKTSTSPVSNPTASPPASTPTNDPTGSISNGTTGNGFQGKFAAHWARLDNGVNIERSELGKITTADLQYLKSAGIENVRLIINPDDGWLHNGQAMNPDGNGYLQSIKAFMDKVTDSGLALVVCPFGYKPSFLTNPGDTANINQHVSWLKEFGAWINKHYDSKDMFIEVFNEPFMAQSEDWWKIQGQFINAVRSVAPDFTIVANSNGRDVDLANQWDFIKSMTQLSPYADDNVVYNIHYYNPIFFTHQGAYWDPTFAQYTNQHWPGTQGYTLDMVKAQFAELNDWAQKNGIYITVNEFGVIQFAPPDERIQWITDIRSAMEKYDWGWDIWDYNKAFGITTTDSSGKTVLMDSIAKALTWGAYQDGEAPWTDYLNTSGKPSTPTPTVPSDPEPTVPQLPQPTTPSTPVVNNPPAGGKSLTADAEFTNSEKFVFSTVDLHKTHTIKNFDSVSGLKMIQDVVDLRGVFEALGGKFSDGVNDYADRRAAVELKTGDLDNNGKALDVQLSIKGVSDFHINLIDPAMHWTTAFDIGNGTSDYDNITVA